MSLTYRTKRILYYGVLPLPRLPLCRLFRAAPSWLRLAHHCLHTGCRVPTGNELPILMQNENGPCPLLALANVLILRGGIYIHPDFSEVSFEELSARLAEHMLDKSATLSESDEELRANQQQNLADGMGLFPKLQV